MSERENAPGFEQVSPVFIVGVPRSGTTLVRMMMDAHPAIMCGPESPWIGGRGLHVPPNLASLAEFLMNDRAGPVKTQPGVSEAAVLQAMASFVDQIMQPAMRARGKIRWADKTPEHILVLPFLHRLFPGAKFVHVLRDGRDVALSTINTQWKSIVFQNKLVPNTFRTALERWVSWIAKLEEDRADIGDAFYTLRYEDLIAGSEREMRALFGFLELRWDECVLRPYEARGAKLHDPLGEGEKTFRMRGSIDHSSACRWQRQLTFRQRRLARNVAETTLLRLGYEPT